jgi:hypothetical protein
VIPGRAQSRGQEGNSPDQAVSGDRVDDAGGKGVHRNDDSGRVQNDRGQIASKSQMSIRRGRVTLKKNGSMEAFTLAVFAVFRS